MLTSAALQIAIAAAATGLGLEPGPHPVGFRVATEEDASPGGPLRMFVWYPATPGAQSMSFRGYVEAEGRGSVDFERRSRELAGRDVTVDETGALLELTTLARLDAPPASGRFPLVLLGGALNGTAYLQTALGEILASHGYVAVSPSSRGLRKDEPLAFDVRGVEALAQDMELALKRLAPDPQVDLSRLGLVGWSVSGVAQAFLEMRRPGVGAFVSLDSGLGYDYGRALLASRPSAVPGTKPAPFLQVDARGPARYVVPRDEAFLRSRKPSWRVSSPALGHAQVTSFGAFLALTSDGGSQVVRAYAAVVQHVRFFLDAHLRGDASARAFFERSPQQNGYPSDLLTAPEDVPAPGPVGLGKDPRVDDVAFAKAAEGCSVPPIRQPEPGQGAPAGRGQRMVGQALSAFAAVPSGSLSNIAFASALENR